MNRESGCQTKEVYVTEGSKIKVSSEIEGMRKKKTILKLHKQSHGRLSRKAGRSQQRVQTLK